MKRRLKLLLFGEPGVGKSSFAVRLPKPFFFTTDGNYEWLDVWGAKDEDHVKVDSWKEAKAEFGKARPGYETYVVDLTEDLFKWAEEEFCIENDIKHISHLSWGEGYDRQRNEFLNTMCKLINEDKHVIFIMHQTAITSKDRRGIETTFYRPSNRIPDKVLDVIEGRMNVLRAYLSIDRDENGNPVKKRMLSLIPKENEWAILRGVNENNLPTDIELDPELFCRLLGLNENEPKEGEPVHKTKPETKPVQEEKKVEKKVETKVETKAEEPKEEVKEEVSEEVSEEVKAEQKEPELAKEKPTTVSTANSIEELRARIKAKLAGGNK